MFYNRVCEHLKSFSKRNRVFYNRVFMHIHSRDKSHSQTFCFIIGFIPYATRNNSYLGCPDIIS